MFISIVTVVYNGEKTIRKTIESILNQDFNDYEYIIVDGLSKDNTINIAKEYESRFEGRLNIYSEKDNGIYDAMNKGIRLAKGDYIWLVNADDFISPNSLQSFFDYCKSNAYPQAVLSGRMNVVDSNTNKIYATTSISNVTNFERNCSKLKMGICHPATIVHREIYKTVGLYDTRYYISADLDFAVRCYKESVNVIFLDLVLTNMTDGGISNKLPIKKCLHDCNIRAEKFCNNILERTIFKIWYFLRLLVIKIRGYKYN